MKKKSILIGVGVLIIIIAIIMCFILLNNKDTSKEDAIRFKEEYESLNDTIRESDGHEYNNVDIPKDNPIVYVTPSEAAKIIESKTGVVYIGANWCPWCRNAAPVLFEAAKNNNISVIYYVDLTDYRNIWEVVDGELVKSQEEKEGYYDLLEALDEILGDSTYKVYDTDGTEFDTQEKRISMPTVIGLKGGKIVGNIVGTVPFEEGQDKYSPLTESQKNELLEKYDELIKKTIPEAKCAVDDACD